MIQNTRLKYLQQYKILYPIFENDFEKELILKNVKRTKICKKKSD